MRLIPFDDVLRSSISNAVDVDEASLRLEHHAAATVMRFSRGEKKGPPDSCLGPKQVQMWYCVEEEGKECFARARTIDYFAYLFLFILHNISYCLLFLFTGIIANTRSKQYINRLSQGWLSNVVFLLLLIIKHD